MRLSLCSYLGVLASNKRVMCHAFASTGLCVCRCQKDNDYLFGLCFESVLLGLWW